jgi:hypothetical protein
MACCGGNPNYEAVCMPKVVTAAPAPELLPANATYQHGTLQAFCNELNLNSEIMLSAIDTASTAPSGNIKPLYVHRQNASVCEWRSLHWNPNGTMTRFFMFLNETANRTSGTVVAWNVQQNTSMAYAVSAGGSPSQGGTDNTNSNSASSGTGGNGGGRRLLTSDAGVLPLPPMLSQGKLYHKTDGKLVSCHADFVTRIPAIGSAFACVTMSIAAIGNNGRQSCAKVEESTAFAGTREGQMLTWANSYTFNPAHSYIYFSNCPPFYVVVSECAKWPVGGKWPCTPNWDTPSAFTI